ncbi:MAG: hypothetical protein NTY77_17980 [Elusimicrobia bacterium]|nr:hypothetical protein [Elusimicrobiota bacterium]
MKRLLLLLKEVVGLIRGHKVYFLLPLLVTLAWLAFLAFKIGPSVVVSFIYAGM